jgi:hypothetical protein
MAKSATSSAKSLSLDSVTAILGNRTLSTLESIKSKAAKVTLLKKAGDLESAGDMHDEVQEMLDKLGDGMTITAVNKLIEQAKKASNSLVAEKVIEQHAAPLDMPDMPDTETPVYVKVVEADANLRVTAQREVKMGQCLFCKQEMQLRKVEKHQAHCIENPKSPAALRAAADAKRRVIEAAPKIERVLTHEPVVVEANPYDSASWEALLGMVKETLRINTQSLEEERQDARNWKTEYDLLSDRVNTMREQVKALEIQVSVNQALANAGLRVEKIDPMLIRAINGMLDKAEKGLKDLDADSRKQDYLRISKVEEASKKTVPVQAPKAPAAVEAPKVKANPNTKYIDYEEFKHLEAREFPDLGKTKVMKPVYRVSQEMKRAIERGETDQEALVVGTTMARDTLLMLGYQVDPKLCKEIATKQLSFAHNMVA